MVLLLIALALLIGGCRGAGEEGVVDLWAMGAEGGVVQQMMPELERLHPGLDVRVQQIPWSAAHEKLLTAYVGGATPCVFQIGNTWIPEFVALDALEPLDARLAASSAVRSDDYFAGVFDTNVVGGTTYGVPWYIDTRLLFYRQDLYADAGAPRAPPNWETWVDDMTRVAQGGDGRRFAILLPLSEWQTPVILAMQLGSDLLRDGGRWGDFEGESFRRAFAFYLDLFRRRLAPRAGDADVGNLYQDFAAGYFAAFVTGPWNLAEVDKRSPPGFGTKWATAPMPAPEGPGPGISVAGGASLAIFKSCRNKDAAWKVIEFLSEPARQVEMYRLSGDLPPRRASWKLADLDADPHAAAFAVQLEHVRSTPKIPEWERIADKIGQYAEAAIREEMSGDAALAALDSDVNEILAKRRWMLERAAAR